MGSNTGQTAMRKLGYVKISEILLEEVVVKFVFRRDNCLTQHNVRWKFIPLSNGVVCKVEFTQSSWVCLRLISFTPFTPRAWRAINEKVICVNIFKHSMSFLERQYFLREKKRWREIAPRLARKAWEAYLYIVCLYQREREREREREWEWELVMLFR